jgi:SAM-dependent methyltransferase
MKKLNLGCGEFKKKGYINLDINKSVKPEVVHDLGKFPYPFKDEYFDLVEADHVLEHTEDPFKTMKEIHRIMKHNATLIIRVPHFSRGFTHADHKRGFDVSFPYYFNPKFKGGYSGVSFQLKKMRLRWFGQMYLKKNAFSKANLLSWRGFRSFY